MWFVISANGVPIQVLPEGTDLTTAERWLAHMRRIHPHSTITLSQTDQIPDGVQVLTELVW